MTKIPKATDRLLFAVFGTAGTSDADREAVVADLRRHGRIRETFGTWQAIVSRCDQDLRDRARFEIGVDERVAMLARSAARFQETAAAEPAAAIVPVIAAAATDEPAAAAPSTDIDMEAIDAWLDEIGLRGHEDISDLTDLQLDTLARIAQKNRRWALLLITHDPLVIAATPGLVLNSLRTIMATGSHEWVRTMSEGGLFNSDPHLMQGSLALLHRAAELANRAQRIGGRFRIRETRNDVRFDLLPQRVRTQLSRKLDAFVPRGRRLMDFTGSTVVDVLIDGDSVVEVMHVGRNRTAFAEPKSVRSPEDYIREQLRGYQLLAVASQVHARNVEVALYGSESFDQHWAKAMEACAREMGIGFQITHNSRWTGGTRYLFGSRRERTDETASSARSYAMPSLRLPKRHGMLAAIDASSAEATVAPQARGGTEAIPVAFRQFADSESQKDEAHARWATAMDRARNSRRLPNRISSQVSTLYLNSYAPSDARKELERLGQLIWDELEEIFSRLDETAADLDSAESNFQDDSIPEEIRVLESELNGISAAEMRVRQLRTEFTRLGEEWETASDLAMLIHPDLQDTFLGSTPDSVVDAFGDTYVPLDGALTKLEGRISRHRLALESRLESARFDTAISDARTAIASASSTVSGIEAQIGRRRAAIAASREARIDTSTSGWRTQFFAVSSELLRPLESISAPVSVGAALRRSSDTLIAIIANIDEADPRHEQVTALQAEIKAAQDDLDRANASIATSQRAHDEYVAHLRHAVLRAEDGVEVPLAPLLPPPPEVGDYLSRTIEGRGHVQFRINSRIPQIRRKLHETVIRRFAGAKALIYDGRLYLIDSRTATDLARWRMSRQQDFRNTDLMGNQFFIPAHALGVRIAETFELGEEHPYNRLRVLFTSYVPNLPIWCRDFVTTVASHVDRPDGSEAWHTLAALMVRTLSSLSPGEDLSPLEAMKVSTIALSMLEDIERSPTLSAYAAQWFIWGDSSSSLRSEFRPLTEDILDRLDQMSEDDMTATIEQTGLIPSEAVDRKTWVDEWRRYERGYLQSAKKGTRNPDTIRMLTAELERLETLPSPYVLVRAIAHRADREFILERRVRLLEADGAHHGSKGLQPLTRRERCLFAVRFLLEHQQIIRGWLNRNDDIDDIMEITELLEGAPDVSSASIAARLESQGHNPTELAELGREYLSNRGPGFVSGIPMTVHIMMGRILEHRDDILISLFSRLVNRTWANMNRSGDSMVDGDGQPMTSQGKEQTFIECIGMSWPEFEDAMSLRPAVSKRADAFFQQRAAKKKDDGGGGPTGNGNPQGGGGPVTPLPSSPQGGSQAQGLSAYEHFGWATRMPLPGFLPTAVTSPWVMGGLRYAGTTSMMPLGFLTTNPMGTAPRITAGF